MITHPSRRFALGFALVMAAVAVAAQPAFAGLPDSPDGTVREVLKQLADRHPEVLWQALPASYQQDITEVTHAAANKVDAEFWKAIFDLGNKATGVLRDKKEFFLSSSMMNAAGDEKARIEGNWDAVVVMLDGFFTSDFSNLETLRSMDWERFLSTTAVDIMDGMSELQSQNESGKTPADMVETLRNTTVEKVSQDGDNATVRITAPGEDPEEVPMTRVEGRWVPSDMADDWESNMAEAKENIANVTDEQMAQAKMQSMMIFGMVGAALDQLAATTTQEEFDQAIQGLIGPFLGMRAAVAEQPEEDEGMGQEE